MSGFLQIWFLFASFGTWYTIEKLGRRRSFMTSAIGMAAVMVVMAAMLAIDTQVSGIVAAAMLFAYQAFYTWGFMGGIWVSSVSFKRKSWVLTVNSVMDQRYSPWPIDPKGLVLPQPFCGSPPLS
jgi:hypothetical protein